MATESESQSLLAKHPPIRKIPSDESLTSDRISIFGFTNPLTINWFFSVVGVEYCHTYFWIAKDLAWMQSWRHFSIFFGLMALGWSLLILYHVIRTVNWHELWNFVALFLWLFANFWWMIGEAHDYEYPDEYPIGIQHSNMSALVLEVALVWLLFYYCIILPCNLMVCNKASLNEYDDNKLKPRLPCFKTFRQYENLHMLFWIAKDLAWNRLNLVLWIICLIPALLIAADFIWISSRTPTDDSMVDIVHFTVIFMWVIGNSVWAFGDFFFENYDEPIRMWIRSEISLRTARWYSSWILFSAIIPVLIMYGVWGTLTITGKLQHKSSRSSSAGRHASNSNGNTWIDIQDLDGFESDAVPSSPSHVISIVTAHNSENGVRSNYPVNYSTKHRNSGTSNNIVDSQGKEIDEFTALL